MGVVPACMVLRMKWGPRNNWPARCQYNVTWVWAYDVLTLTHSEVLEMSRGGGGGHKLAIVVSKIRNKINGLHGIYG